MLFARRLYNIFHRGRACGFPSAFLLRIAAGVSFAIVKGGVALRSGLLFVFVSGVGGALFYFGLLCFKALCSKITTKANWYILARRTVWKKQRFISQIFMRRRR